MATGSISSPGIGSNLDVSGIVSKLMALEQQPVAQLNSREGALQSQISLIGQIKSTVSSIQTAAKSLSSAVSAAAFRATSSNTDVLAARTSAGVSTGSYAVTVTDIAKAQRIASAGLASKTSQIGTGAATTLTLSFGAISGGTLDSDTGIYSGASFTPNFDKSPVTISIDSTNNTLEGIRNAINNASAGVTASIVNDGSATPYRLVFNAVDSGVANSIKIDVSGDAALQNLVSYDPAGTQSLSQLQIAQNARLSVDGVGITSSSNSVSGVIDGLTLDLKVPGSSTVTIGRDITQIAATLSQLVKSYNDANKAIGEATKKGADMQGDYGIISAQARLRNVIGTLRPGFGSVNSPSQLGVSFARDGSLTFDSSKLQSALSNDFSSVSGLLGDFATALSGATTALLGTTGNFQAKTDSINLSIKDISARRDVLNRRLSQIQAGYLAQFNALDTMISNLRQTSAFLDQQLAILPKISN